jgi:hypothetical protein
MLRGASLLCRNFGLRYLKALKKSRWCVLKRKANLTPQQRFRLRDLLRYNLKTVSEPFVSPNSRSITLLANCPNLN